MAAPPRNSDGLRYREFTDPFARFRLAPWICALCGTGIDRPSVLFDRATAWLVTKKVLLPGASALEQPGAALSSSRRRGSTGILIRLPRTGYNLDILKEWIQMSGLAESPNDFDFSPGDRRFLARARKRIKRKLDGFFITQREAVASVRHDENYEEMGNLADALVDLFEEVLSFVPPMMRTAILASLVAELPPGDQEIQRMVDQAAGIHMGRLLCSPGTQATSGERWSRFNSRQG